ncbi:MAG: DarT ssDNA thymidine ADP-ribosyltransferase family protein [Thermomicrobiales bacterium]
MQRKPDADAIGAFFDELGQQPWLYAKQRHWPRFFFHVTDASNVVSILRDACLYSRDEVESTGRKRHDNASADVLSGTDPECLRSVRLYFRPRTPTFWHNEGICPKGHCSQYQAHCPMPVALLFDSAEVGGLEGVAFSDGNLAGAHTRIGDDIDFLRSLDFRDIYHDQPLPVAGRERIRSARQAEVTTPSGLPLSSLRWVVSRSVAERQKLQTLLDQERVRSPVAEQAFVSDYQCFVGERTYVERIDHTGTHVQVTFNSATKTPGPYRVQVTLTDPTTGELFTDDFSTRTDTALRYALPASLRERNVRVVLLLDGFRAFAGDVQPRPAMSLLR